MNCHCTGVVILGAGLQGAGVALELARRGMRVTLIDQDPRPLNRASLRNEGKIHLGLIYANDRSLTTAFLQLEGALRFRSILARWIGRGDEWLVPSTPFYYLVARDSLVAPDRLAEHYWAVEQRCRERFEEDASLQFEVRGVQQIPEVLKQAGKDTPVTMVPGVDHIQLILSPVALEKSIEALKSLRSRQ